MDLRRKKVEAELAVAHRYDPLEISMLICGALIGVCGFVDLLGLLPNGVTPYSHTTISHWISGSFLLLVGSGLTFVGSRFIRKKETDRYNAAFQKALKEIEKEWPNIQ